MMRDAAELRGDAELRSARCRAFARVRAQPLRRFAPLQLRISWEGG
jgi:hypothetical protein